MKTLIIHSDYLAGRDALEAQYLAALSAYRAAAAEFAAALQSGQPADSTNLDTLAAELTAIESDDEFVRGRMIPLADAADRLGYSQSHMKRICRDHGPDGDNQVRAEHRHGKLWYVYVPDIEYLISTGGIYGPRNPDV